MRYINLRLTYLVTYALLRGILRREISGAPLQRTVVLKWFYSLRRRTIIVGGKCALPSAVLVFQMQCSLGVRRARPAHVASDTLVLLDIIPSVSFVK